MEGVGQIKKGQCIFGDNVEYIPICIYVPYQVSLN